MRTTVIWLALVAAAVAEYAEEPWVEEEDIGDMYNEEREEEAHDRRRREAYVEQPYEEHIRVKRRCYDEPEVYRERRSAEYIRVPRQVHQYEVHEFTDESMPSSPPYEEMLAASAEHYHKVYAAPGAPASARYLHDVSPNIAVRSVSEPSNSHISVNPSAQVNVAPAPGNFVPSFGPGNAPNNRVQFVPHVNVAPAPLSIASPISIANSPVDGPIPIASVPVSQPLQQLAGNDQLVAAAGHHKKHSHGHSQGGGHEHQGHHYGQHGGKSVKGFKTDHHVDKGGKGYKLDENHRKEYEEAAGKKRKHHDRADHKGSHEEQAHGQRGSHFDEKKGHKKGHKTKGYHNKYHKDEFHKEHKFYDDFHKSGEHHRFGKFNAKHASNESGKKKAHHVNAGHDFVERGKKGYSNKGHMDADHKGHKGKHGHDEHSEHQSQYGKKGGKAGGSQWGYEKKN